MDMLFEGPIEVWFEIYLISFWEAIDFLWTVLCRLLSTSKDVLALNTFIFLFTCNLGFVLSTVFLSELKIAKVSPDTVLRFEMWRFE